MRTKEPQYQICLSEKIIFFLFIYYLAIDPILHLVNVYLFEGELFRLPTPLDIISLEHIIFIATLFLIISRTISIEKYLNFGTTYTLFLFVWIFFIIIVSFYGVVEVVKTNFWKYNYYFRLIICQGFIFIMLGLNVHLINDLFQIKKYKFIFYAVTIFYFAIILSSSILNPLSALYPWYLCGIPGGIYGSDAIVDHLYISDTVALLLFVIISRAKNINIKILIIPSGAFLILLSGSRATFVFFIVSALIVLTIKLLTASIKEKLVFVAVILLSISIISSINIGLAELPAQYLETHRFNLYEILNDESYILRGIFFRTGLRELEEHWFLGRYMSEVIEGRPGTYIHNWLSFWSAFGLVPFLFFIFMIIFVMYRISILFINDLNSTIKEFLFLCSIFMILSICFARAYTYHFIWFILSAVPMISHRFERNFGQQ
jgi:hypothetical protein